MSRASTIAPLLLAAAGALVSVAATSGRTAGQDVVPLTRSDLIRILEGDTYTPDEAARMVRRACVDFRPSDDDLRRFRELGATGEVVDALVGCRREEDGDESAEAPAPEPAVGLVLPDDVTARVGDTVRVRGRVEREGRGAHGVPIMLESEGAGESGARRVVAATSGPDGTIVFPVPAGLTSGRITFRPRAQAASLAGDPRMELIVRPGPLRWVDVRPEELLLSPDREAPRAVRVRLRDAHGNGLPAVMVLLVSEAPPAGPALARGLTGSGGEARLSVSGERLGGVERVGVWARDSLLIWVPVRTTGDEPDRAGGSATGVHRHGGPRDGGQGREP